MSDDKLEEVKKEIVELDLEIKSGTHVKGAEYPTHDFSVFDDMFKDRKQSMTLATNNDMVKIAIDEAHEKFPERDIVMYFYLAPKV